MENNSNMESKEISAQKLETFLNKVQKKLSAGIEEIGAENVNVLNDWIKELNFSKDENVKIQYNKNLYEENIHRDKENGSILLNTLKRLSSNELTLSEKEGLMDIFKKDSVNLLEYSEKSSIITDLDQMLTNLLAGENNNLEFERTNISILISTILLEKINSNKWNISFHIFLEEFMKKLKELLVFPEYRLRSNLPTLLKEILWTIYLNHQEKLYDYFWEIFNVSRGDMLHIYSILEPEQDEASHNHDKDKKCCSVENKTTTLDTTKAILIEVLKFLLKIKQINPELFISLNINLFNQDDFLNKIIEHLDFKNKGIIICSYEILQNMVYFFEEESVSMYLQVILGKIGSTLTDFYPQVRFAALNFIFALNEKWSNLLLSQDSFNNSILPKICVNRYLPVQGVKSNSLEIWKNIVGSNGIQILTKNFKNYLNTYISEIQSKSHNSKEAGIRSMQELVMKVYDNLNSYHNQCFYEKIPLIMEILLFSIKDPCWNVREVAFYCLPYIILNFQSTEHIQLESMSNIVSIIFFHLLFDNISEVRNSAAFTIRTIIFCSGKTSKNMEISQKISINFHLLDTVKSLMKQLESKEEIEKSYIVFKERLVKYIGENNDFGFTKEPIQADYVDGIFCLIKEIFEEDKAYVQLYKLEAIVTLVSDYFNKNYSSLENIYKKTIWLALVVIFSKMKRHDLEFYIDLVKKLIIQEISGKNKYKNFRPL
jgi:hypothetical protein